MMMWYVGAIKAAPWTFAGLVGMIALRVLGTMRRLEMSGSASSQK